MPHGFYFSLSLSPCSVRWKVVHGSVLTLRCPLDLPDMPSLTWQRVNSISSEFSQLTSMEPVSHLIILDLLRLMN